MDKRILWLAQAFAAAALLAACGGGDDSPAPVPAPVPVPAPAPGPLAEVPPSASESDAGMVAYLQALNAANAEAEADEPVDVGSFSPPSPDDTEPEPVS